MINIKLETWCSKAILQAQFDKYDNGFYNFDLRFERTKKLVQKAFSFGGTLF